MQAGRGTEAIPLGRLEVGDFLPDFQLRNQRNAVTVLSRKSLGKPVLVLFLPDHQKPACQQMLRSFARHHDALRDLAHIFVVSNESVEANHKVAIRDGLPFDFLLSDPGARVSLMYGVAHNQAGAQDAFGHGAFTTVVADANRRVLRIDRGITEPAHAETLLAFLRDRPVSQAREVGPMAPVLYVPGVLDPALCQTLMTVYETQGNSPTGVQRDRSDGSGAQAMNPDAKVRRDHTVSDPDLNRTIKDLIARRVLPEIEKAFAYRVTHLEVFKIACYEAEAGGHFRPHRDNVSVSSAHRRFAMTLNLNTGSYEGGQLRFLEYGPDLYSPAAGDAVVFSCSLLHEVLPVTAGRRYVLLAFLYGADGEQIMKMRPAQPGLERFRF